MNSIPLIDLSSLKISDQANPATINQNHIHQNNINHNNIAKQIYQACHEIGFMYIQNSVISAAKLEQVFQQSKSFFRQPLAIKQQLAWSDEFSNTGYVELERERLNPDQPGDLKEAVNISNQQLTDTSLSPLSLPKNPVIQSFYQDCIQLANLVLQAFALALELPTDFLITRHNHHNHTLRFLHYPPLQTSPQPGQARAGEHSDYGSLTLLFQDGVGGLEVQTTGGEWIVAPPIPGTVLVNTGDLMQRWTNQIFCSTKHRVKIPDDEKINQSRYSIAFFCHPNQDTEIACLQSCCQQCEPIYPPILAGEYLISRLQATY